MKGKNYVMKNLLEILQPFSKVAIDSLVAFGIGLSGHIGLFGLGGIISGFRANGHW